MCWSARAFETGPGRCSAVRHEAVFIVAQGVDGRILACGEPIDRVYLNVYVPMLQAGAGTAHFLPKVRGNPVLSSALMEPITRGFVVAIKRYSATEGTDLIQFERTERQDERTRAYLLDFTANEGVLYADKAQENAPVHRGEPERRFG